MEQRYKIRAGELPYDKLLKNHNYVITGECALARNGLIYFNAMHLMVYTSYEDLDKLTAGPITYYYCDNIDEENYTIQMSTNEKLLLPTAERAIIEYIMNPDRCDEGLLLEALDSYINRNQDISKLYEVSDFYGCDRQKLEYWISQLDETE